MVWDRREWCRTAALSMLLSGCAPWLSRTASLRSAQLRADDPAWSAQILILGEQHDAPEHQRIQAEVVESLVRKQRLAALVLEMADAPLNTQGLARDATPEQVQARLNWTEGAWPWSSYAPSIMQAVRAGVVVHGSNLPRAEMPAAMRNTAIDTAVTEAAWQALIAAVDSGHCHLLPESQWVPMARIQVAKDQRMAATVAKNVAPERTVVMLCGSAHAHRLHGIPAHLPVDLAKRTHSVHLRSASHEPAEAGAFDADWLTEAVPDKDYCAELRQRWGKKAS